MSNSRVAKSPPIVDWGRIPRETRTCTITESAKSSVPFSSSKSSSKPPSSSYMAKAKAKASPSKAKPKFSKSKAESSKLKVKLKAKAKSSKPKPKPKPKVTRKVVSKRKVACHASFEESEYESDSSAASAENNYDDDDDDEPTTSRFIAKPSSSAISRTRTRTSKVKKVPSIVSSSSASSSSSSRSKKSLTATNTTTLYRKKNIVITPIIATNTSDATTSTTIPTFKPKFPSWEERFRELKAFHKVHGHFYPSAFVPDQKSLHNWVAHQRSRDRNEELRKRKNIGPPLLTKEQKQKLNDIQFPWCSDLSGLKWNQQFQGLKEQYASGVPIIRQSRFVLQQRYIRNQGKLLPERIKLLESIGFDWGKGKPKRSISVSNATRKLARHNNNNSSNNEGVLSSYDDDDDDDNNKVQPSTLSAKKLHILALRWREKFEQLKAYHQNFGHYFPSMLNGKDEEERKLACWVQYQRARKVGRRVLPLTKYEMDMLDSINFSWTGNLVGWRWDRDFKELQEFHKTHGHFNILNTQQLELHTFMEAQRIHNNSGDLQPDRSKLLASIGFSFSSFECDEMHQGEEGKLKTLESKGIHDDTSKKSKGKDTVFNPSQPSVHASDDDIDHDVDNDSADDNYDDDDGVASGAYNVLWRTRFRELKDFHKKHGHYFPSKNDKGCEDLNVWVKYQRYRKKGGPRISPLTKQELELLDSINFTWVSDKLGWIWKQEFRKLKEYWKIHGHIDVLNKKELALHNFAEKQRYDISIRKLQPYRKQLLKSIGFECGSEGNSALKKRDSNGAGAPQMTGRRTRGADTSITERKNILSDPAPFRNIGILKSSECEATERTNKKREQKGEMDSKNRDDSSSQSSPEPGKRKKKRKRKGRIATHHHDHNNSTSSHFQSLSPEQNEKCNIIPSSAASGLDIGSRVAVYWSGEDEFYAGTVSRQFGRTAFVDYDDGDSEWIDTNKHHFRILCTTNK